MSWFDAVVLGLVQGLTEFLPVSSSGHLVMAQTILEDLNGGSRTWRTPGILLEVSLHVATLISVVLVYRRRLMGLAAGAWAREPDAWRYLGLLAIATAPAVAVGLFARGPAEAAFEVPALTGVLLLVTGAILWSTRAVPPGSMERPAPAVALLIGIAQAIAILPGISRSGTTIATGLWAKLDGERAAEFSFLMSVPAIAGAALLQALDLSDAGAAAPGAPGPTITGPLVVAFMTALVAGVAAIKSLVWLVRRQGFHHFAWYVWAAGLFFLAYLRLA